MKPIYISTKRLAYKETFCVPEGHYRGVVSRVDSRETGNGTEIIIRFSLDWSRDGVQGVARTCISSKGVDYLVHTLEGWIGAQEVERLSDNNGRMDLQCLVGRSADLCIVERDPTPPHKETLRTIEGIYPPGTLIKGVADKIGECEI